MHDGSPVRAFVAGATGYTGRATVTALRERGIETIAHVRPDSPRLAELRADFEAQGASVDTTAWEPEALAASLRRAQPTLVFALLGTTRKRARAEGMAATQAYARVDYGLTRWLIDAAAACGSRPRFVYLSAIGVEPDAANPYFAARARAEAALRDSGLPWTIVRPALISGGDRAERRSGERAAAVVGDAVLGVVGLLGGARVRDRYRSMDAAALARGLVRVALDPAFVDRVVLPEALR
ncbi:MAG: NAD(P)H-binding protein [Nannocystaceae bacterium]|nr:NAD(P)H-binding protein [Nannocystaceae bacterium]